MQNSSIGNTLTVTKSKRRVDTTLGAYIYQYFISVNGYYSYEYRMSTEGAEQIFAAYKQLGYTITIIETQN